MYLALFYKKSNKNANLLLGTDDASSDAMHEVVDKLCTYWDWNLYYVSIYCLINWLKTFSLFCTEFAIKSERGYAEHDKSHAKASTKSK